MAGLIGFGIDQIKEKIKKNEEARQSGLVIDSLEARIADSAKDKSPEELEGFSKAFDALRKAKLTTTETLAVAKTLAPDMFSEMGSLGAMPAVVFDPDTGTYSDTQGNTIDNIRRGQTVRNRAISPEFSADRAAATSEASTRAKEEVQLDYPQLDDKTKSAVSAYRFIEPRVKGLETLIDGGLFKDAALLKQIAVDASGDLVVPDGSPLEEAIGLINDIKLTGFNIAGTAFTGTEKEVAFNLLNPVGKSDKRYKRDLNSFKDLFGTRVEAGVEGLRGAKTTAAQSKASKEISGMSDDELRKLAGL